MGKSRNPQDRLDTYYRRAKEAGYRARSAYKLIQLNKKYDILTGARVCIDLCAAPGSWMQVCTKLMPPSSFIVGVDRFKIPPIPNAVAIQGDITTEKVRAELTSQLKKYKADVVLHDGAPSVGKNWSQDAYDQNVLVLHAFRLACEFLKKGGIFVTKVFRSADHFSLIYVFKKLFHKVESTRPLASRYTSAEIFVVCKGFFSPDELDPKFFDAKHVFASVQDESKKTLNLATLDKKKKAEGYADDVSMLFRREKISEFIRSQDFLEILANVNEFEWDVPFVLDSPRTTADIVEYCRDIKVLGRKELQQLMRWRKALRSEIKELRSTKEKEKEAAREEEKAAAEEEDEEKGEGADEVEAELGALHSIQEQIEQLKEAQRRTERREERRKKRLERRRREKEALLKAATGGPVGSGPVEVDTQLFSLKRVAAEGGIKTHPDALVDCPANTLRRDSSMKPSKQKVWNPIDYSSDEDDGALGSDSESDGEESGWLGLGAPLTGPKDDEGQAADWGNDLEEVERAVQKEVGIVGGESLLTDLQGDEPDTNRVRQKKVWFEKDAFERVDEESLEEAELRHAAEEVERCGGIVVKPKEQQKPTKKKADQIRDAPDEDSEDDAEEQKSSKKKKGEEEDGGKKKKKKPHLTPEGLALATRMIKSKKMMSRIIERSYNRYMNEDEDEFIGKLPLWFVRDEETHCRPKLEVNPRDVQMYVQRDESSNVRSLKKVTEAKARKRRRLAKRLKSAARKASTITDSAEMSAREKHLELNKIYKKTLNTEKRERKYHVMTKGSKGKKPKGMKGPYRLVDKRMKADNRMVHAPGGGRKKRIRERKMKDNQRREFFRKKTGATRGESSTAPLRRQVEKKK